MRCIRDAKAELAGGLDASNLDRCDYRFCAQCSGSFIEFNNRFVNALVDTVCSL
jgi:hypothetical protein